MEPSVGRLRVFWFLSVDGWFAFADFSPFCFVVYFLVPIPKLADMFTRTGSRFPLGFITFKLPPISHSLL